jgi:hypothetical protein
MIASTAAGQRKTYLQSDTMTIKNGKKDRSTFAAIENPYTWTSVSIQ